MYPAFHGAQWLHEQVCYFLILIAIKIKTEWNFKYFRQLVNGFINFFHSQTAFCSIADGSLFLVNEKIIARIVEDGFLF